MAETYNNLKKKTFREFTASNTKLYHSTRFAVAISILSGGEIQPRTTHLKSLINIEPYEDPDVLVSGVSMTRNYNYASNWDITGIILEFDRDLLKQRYKIVPVNWYSARRGISKTGKVTEFEEFVVTTRPIPLDKYLTGIWIPGGSKYKTLASFEKRYQDPDPLYYEAVKRLVFENPKFKGVR